MSKLDRFLISENLWNSHPNINAVTLDRHLSDHRPILLRESITDYGPTPFRFYNSWIEIDGFKELVEDSWRDAPVDNCNGMRTFMFKLKFLKNKIKEWNSRFLKNSKADLTRLQEELKQIDAEIDCGKGNDSIVAQRLDVMNSINNIVKIYDSQALQKAKIKWAGRHNLNGLFFFYCLKRSCALVFFRNEDENYLLFKVDFEKAYDSVRWDFLDEVLRKYGFGDKWRRWIQSCLSSSRGSILINGSPTRSSNFLEA
ncbi:RNA-directed DNA polymerase, eukaryota [Tanacetum coccineum]|uniref:RNA-directed DNA polymerase, eukaryota n=1 Tax=Tanacetum coccineum TaxID=301880 RepID=A0ABQ4XAA8_9ASTR